jgi:hypothetical protein
MPFHIVQVYLRIFHRIFLVLVPLFSTTYVKATATVHITLSLLCGEQKRQNAGACVKYWEIIADDLKKSRLELGLRVSLGFSSANNLDCRCASGIRKAFRCACRREAECVFGTGIGNSQK